MSLLRIKQADGSWSNIPAIKGADGIDGKDGKDGAVQYAAGRYIQIDDNTNTINCTVKIGDLVIIDAVPVKDSTNVVSSGGVYDALETKADKTEIAGLGSEAGFITNSVEDLKNYYKKSETYSQEEVNSLIGNLTRLTLQVVQELPEVGTEHIIYLVPKNESGNNIYEEWLFVQSKWEMIGSTEVDLSNYYTKEEIDALMANNSDDSEFVIINLTSSITDLAGDVNSSSHYTKKRVFTLNETDRLAVTEFLNKYWDGNNAPTKELILRSGGRFFPLTYTGPSWGSDSIGANFKSQTIVPQDSSKQMYAFTISFHVKGSAGSFTPHYSGSLSYWSSSIIFITDYLNTQNTKPYTPTADYHPATKKYVDYAVANAGGGGGSEGTSSNNNIYEIKAEQNLGTISSDLWSANDVVLEVMNKYLKGEIEIPAFRITSLNNTGIFNRDLCLRIGLISDLTYTYFGSHLAVQESGWDNALMLHDYKMTFTLKQDSATGNYVLDGSISWDYNRRRVLAEGIDASYTPTGDYHPATKKYVDDAVANAEAGGGEGTDLSNYYTKEEINALIPTEDELTRMPYIMVSYSLNNSDSIRELEKVFTEHYKKHNNINTLMFGIIDFNASYIEILRWKNNGTGEGGRPTTVTFNVIHFSTSDIVNTWISEYSWRFSFDSENNISISSFTPTTISSLTNSFLSKSNKTAFTPTGDYHPATKKYVDDAVANAGGGETPDLTAYAKLTDVLSKTNTTEYTPASAYHPATKQYVDQTVASAGGITEESDPTVPLYVKNITQDMITKWNNASDETALTTKIENIVATMVGENIAISYNTEDAFNDNKGVITDTSAIDDFILSTNEKIGKGEYPSIKIYLTKDDSHSSNKTTCVDLSYNSDYFYGTLYPTSSHSILMSAYGTEACMIKVDLAVNNTTIQIKPLVTLKTLVSNNDVSTYNGEHNFYTGLDNLDIMDTANTLYTDLNIAIDHQFLEFPIASGYKAPNGRKLRLGLYKGRPAFAFDSYNIGVSVGVFNTYDELMQSSYCQEVSLSGDTYNLCVIAETKLSKKTFSIRQINKDGYMGIEPGSTQLSWVLGIPEWSGIGTNSGGGQGTQPIPEYLIPLISKDTGETLWATLYAFQDTNDTESLIFRLCLVNHLNDTRFTGKTYDLGGLCLTTPIVEIPGGNATHAYVFKPVPADDFSIKYFKVFEYDRWLETPEVQ